MARGSQPIYLSGMPEGMPVRVSSARMVGGKYIVVYEGGGAWRQG